MRKNLSTAYRSSKHTWPNISVPNFTKETLLDLKFLMSNFNTPFSPIDGSSGKKLKKKKALELNDIINHINLTDIYRMSLPNTKVYMFILAVHENFSKMNHLQDTKNASIKTEN